MFIASSTRKRVRVASSGTPPPRPGLCLILLCFPWIIQPTSTEYLPHAASLSLFQGWDRVSSVSSPPPPPCAAGFRCLVSSVGNRSGLWCLPCPSSHGPKMLMPYLFLTAEGSVIFDLCQVIIHEVTRHEGYFLKYSPTTSLFYYLFSPSPERLNQNLFRVLTCW